MSVAPANRAIVHRRLEPDDSLDFFPTPPWATRALFHHVLGRKRFLGLTAEEPACGEGHMAYVLDEFFGDVRASDIHDYGYGPGGQGAIRDFLEPSAWTDIERPDWILTNPPFADKTIGFMLAALARARRGVAFFLRLSQLEGISRYRDVYRSTPPTIIAFFVERVPCHKGRWEPEGGTFTAYCWLIWHKTPSGAFASSRPPCWIPPCRRELTYARDIERFGATAAYGEPVA